MEPIDAVDLKSSEGTGYDTEVEDWSDIGAVELRQRYQRTERMKPRPMVEKLAPLDLNGPNVTIRVDPPRTIARERPLFGVYARSLNPHNTFKEFKLHTTRGCDQCNTAHAKCSVGIPCERCAAHGLECTDLRGEKPRGQASEKQQQNKALGKRKTRKSDSWRYKDDQFFPQAKKDRLGPAKREKKKNKNEKALDRWQAAQAVAEKALHEMSITRWGVRNVDHDLTITQTMQIGTADSLSVITLARCSSAWPEGGYDRIMLGNVVIASKVEADFIHPTFVHAHESVAWHDTKGWHPFPETHPNEGIIPLLPDDDTNRINDARFIEFFRNRPDYSRVIMIIRGADGARIERGTWIRLKQRFPLLRIQLIFALKQSYVNDRAPANADATWFTRSVPHDGFLYAFFELDTLAQQIANVAHDARYQWLLDEWTAGMVGRNDLSRAHQRNAHHHISLGTTNYATLKTYGRNDWPTLP